jgi:hypothetical protein
MRLLISFAALFLSVVLLQLGSGGVAPLDALSGAQLDFSGRRSACWARRISWASSSAAGGRRG